MNEGNLQTLLSGKSKIGLDLTVNKDSAIMLALIVISAIVIGGLLLKMLSNIFGLN